MKDDFIISNEKIFCELLNFLHTTNIILSKS